MGANNPRYGIVIDDSNIDDEGLRQYLIFISSNKLFSDWHSPFRGFVIVESEHELIKIHDNITDYFGNKIRSFVTEMPYRRSRGAFAEQTWAWLKRFEVEDESSEA